MDSGLILVRTAAGDAALQQPTRLVQRNLRMALMLVDGERSVAEILARFGNVAIGEAALADLHRSGLIETAEERQRRGETGGGAPAADGSVKTGGPPATGSPSSPVPNTGARLPSAVAESTAAARFAAVNRAGSPQPTTASARHALEMPSQAAPPTRVHDENLPVQRVRDARPRAGRYVAPGWALLAVGAIVLLIAALITSYPYESRRPQLERNLAGALGQPVTIARVRFAWAPRPNLVLEDVRIGGDKPLTVGAIRLLPDPRSFLGDQVIVRDLTLERPELPVAELPAVAGWLSMALKDKRLVVHHLRFAGATVVLAGTRLDGLQGEVDMGEGDALRALHFGGGEGSSLRGELVPDTTGYRVKLTTTDWKPGLLAPVAFDYFDAEGQLSRESMRLTRVYGRVADGSVLGQATMSWSGELGATVELRFVDLGKLLAQIKPDLSLRGTVSGSLAVSAAAPGDSTPGQGLALEGNLSVHHGSIDRFDLVEAVRSANRGPVRGGSTRFEDLSAHVQIDPRAWRLSRVRIRSGLMSAEGQIALDHDRKLSGQVTVELRGSSGNLRVPVTVSGSLQDPVLSGRRALAAPGVPTP